MIRADSSRDADLQRYLSGESLIGDDFSLDEIASWFADEKEACFEIRGGLADYPYHARNVLYGYRRFPDKRFRHTLCFGGGTGAELLPIRGCLSRVTILEASANFKPVVDAVYASSNMDGSIPFPDQTFDLVTCIGVLHHIPNVSTVLKELCRCMMEGGIALVSEPTTSMGGWMQPRAGLSKHERGIPLPLFRSAIKRAGFDVVAEHKCGFGPINYIARTFAWNPFNSALMVRLDQVLCALPWWSEKYHAASGFDKIRPTTVFYVLRKPVHKPSPR